MTTATVAPRRRADWRHRAMLVGVKAVHSLIFFVVEASMLAVVRDGFRGRADQCTVWAATIVTGEVVVFLGNRCRCPLTSVAERLGADAGGVTDIYLPRWLAANLPAIHVPLVVLALWLHRDRLRTDLHKRASRRPARPGD